MSPKTFSEKKIKDFLESQYNRFHKQSYLSTDPLEIVYEYSEDERPLVAFITALCSYGRVNSIRHFVKQLLSRLENSPSRFLQQKWSPKELKPICQGLVYRFYSTEDLVELLYSIHLALKKWKHLNNMAHHCWKADHIDGLVHFQRIFTQSFKNSTPGLRFMFSDPQKSSAKRWHMFLRWVVRKDQIDLGCWDFIPKKNLLIPLDVHLFRISKLLKLTERKSPHLKTTLEISSSLRRFDAEDPIRFDFSLCRWGMIEGNRNDLKSDLKSISRTRL
jgi:uncharacterized protein (TIGR02757 family)